MRFSFLYSLLLAGFAGLGLGADPLFAQDSGDSTGDPIQIEAEGGIDWFRDEKKYEARVNAIASRGDLRIRADRLTAYYDDSGERTLITRIEAVGRVILTQGETRAEGDRGTYHIDQKRAFLIGRNLQISNLSGVIMADDSLEYWEQKGVAIARGQALVIQDENRLQAGTLTAFIDPDQTNSSEADTGPKRPETQITRIDAEDGVHLSTPEEIVIANEGVYDMVAQTVRMCGDVKVTRAGNLVTGNCAFVDLETGKSRLESGPDGEKVKGLILPAS